MKEKLLFLISPVLTFISLSLLLHAGHREKALTILTFNGQTLALLALVVFATYALIYVAHRRLGRRPLTLGRVLFSNFPNIALIHAVILSLLPKSVLIAILFLLVLLFFGMKSFILGDE